MKLFYIILLTIFYVINSKIYLLTYDKILYKKYNKNITYNILWLILASIITLKQFSKLLFNSTVLLSVTSILMLLFHIFILAYFFEGTIKAKIIALGIPFTICILIDVMVMGICSFMLQMQVSDLSNITLSNVIASGLSSSISILAYYIYLKISTRHDTQMLYKYNDVYIISIINLVIVVPSIIIFNNISVLKDNLSIIVIIQFGIIALISILCSIIMCHKNTVVFQTSFKTRELEKELIYYNKIAESFDQLRKLRHDMLNHVGMIHMLLKRNETDKTIAYIESLSDDIKLSRDICTYDDSFPDDKLISIILTEKFMDARARGITVSDSIITNPFFYEVVGKMKDTEKVSLFSNLLDNAIDAAEQTETKYIKFEITVGGMENKNGEICCVLVIRCKNELPHKLETNGNGNFRTTKKDKFLHGFGMGIIDDIVHKYGGTINKGINLENEHFRQYTIDFDCENFYKEPTTQNFETEIIFERGVMDEENEPLFKNHFGIYETSKRKCN